MRCLLAGSAILLAAAGTAVASTTSAAASQVTAAVSKAPGRPTPVKVTPCAGKKVTGPFVANGNQVYTNGGKGHKGATVFRSYGPTIAFTLDAKKWTNPTVTNDMDEKEIKWAAKDWCANTVRIQVNQDLLDPTGTLLGIDTSYLNAIKAEVRYAEHFGLVVVLNDSTESSANSGNEAGPTTTTIIFWLWMASIYSHGSGPKHVIFDLFNEPRVASTQTAPTASQWKTWLNGNGTYYGMNQLAQAVHYLAPNNLLWIEGPNYSDSFAGMYPNYRIKLSNGAPMPNVVYAIHHPMAITQKNSNGKTKYIENPTAWNRAFGYLLGDNLPVVEGEWTNFAGAGVGVNSACWTDAIAEVPMYLNSYLTTNHIGLSAYTLNSGRLLYTFYAVKNGKTTATSKPLYPTVFPQKTSIGWSCYPSTYSVQAKTAGTEGAGQDIYNFFKARNQKA